MRASRCCGGRETRRLVLHVSVLDRLSGHADGDVLSQCGGDMAAEDGESGEVGNTAAAAFIVRART